MCWLKVFMETWEKTWGVGSRINSTMTRKLVLPTLIISMLRATTHTRQEPWPCNGEDPWLSSKGCTMGVREVVLGVHRPSSIVWNENGPCCETIAYIVGRRRGKDLVNLRCLKLYQFQNTTWWCLSVLEPNIYSDICYEICPEICHVEKIFKKIMVSRNTHQAHLSEIGLT